MRRVVGVLSGPSGPAQEAPSAAPEVAPEVRSPSAAVRTATLACAPPVCAGCIALFAWVSRSHFRATRPAASRARGPTFVGCAYPRLKGGGYARAYRVHNA